MKFFTSIFVTATLLVGTTTAKGNGDKNGKSCVDSASFRFDGDSDKDCAWVFMKQKRCNKTSSNKKKKNKFLCPSKCRNKCISSASPSVSPTSLPSSSPSSNPVSQPSTSPSNGPACWTFMEGYHVNKKCSKHTYKDLVEAQAACMADLHCFGIHRQDGLCDGNFSTNIPKDATWKFGNKLKDKMWGYRLDDRYGVGCTPSVNPSESPSVKPTYRADCENVKDYFFLWGKNNEKKGDCEWVFNNSKCDKIDKNDVQNPKRPNRPASFFCPAQCTAICYSSSPSVNPSDSPSVAPTYRADCENVKDYLFKGKKKRDCDWVFNNSKCDEKDKKDVQTPKRKASFFCPAQCLAICLVVDNDE